MPSNCVVGVTGQCCSDADCPSDERCAFFTCVPSVSFEIIMTWSGSSDLDLHVITPDLAEIFHLNPFDPVTSGRLEEDVIPDGSGTFTERVFFILPVAGDYVINPRRKDPSAFPDTWSLEAIANGVTILSGASGTGDGNFISVRYTPI